MIPPPERTCPKCGNPIPLGSLTCSVCGRAKKPLLILWAVLLVLIGGPAALYGGCMILLSGMSGTPGSRAVNETLLQGLLVLLLPVFFLIMLIRAARK